MKPRNKGRNVPKASHWQLAGGEDLPGRRWETLWPIGYQAELRGKRMPTLDAPEHRIPENEYQALLEAAPHDEPVVSRAERLAGPTPALTALHQLDEMDREIVERRVFERQSFQAIAHEMGFPHRMWVCRRWHDRIVPELRELLGDEFSQLTDNEGETDGSNE